MKDGTLTMPAWKGIHVNEAIKSIFRLACMLRKTKDLAKGYRLAKEIKQTISVMDRLLEENQ